MKYMFWVFTAALLCSPLGVEANQAGPRSMPGQRQQQQPCPACAAPGGGMGAGMGMGMRMGKGMGMAHGGAMSMANVLIGNADQLKLTDEQIGKLFRIAQKHAETRRTTMMAVHGSMMSLHAQLLDPNADEAKVRETAKRHSESFNKMVAGGLEERKEALAVLTAAQRKTLGTLKLTQGGEDDDAESDDQAEAHTGH